MVERNGSHGGRESRNKAVRSQINGSVELDGLDECVDDTNSLGGDVAISISNGVRESEWLSANQSGVRAGHRRGRQEDREDSVDLRRGGQFGVGNSGRRSLGSENQDRVVSARSSPAETSVAVESVQQCLRNSGGRGGRAGSLDVVKSVGDTVGRRSQGSEHIDVAVGIDGRNTHQGVVALGVQVVQQSGDLSAQSGKCGRRQTVEINQDHHVNFRRAGNLDGDGQVNGSSSADQVAQVDAVLSGVNRDVDLSGREARKQLGVGSGVASQVLRSRAFYNNSALANMVLDNVVVRLTAQSLTLDDHGVLAVNIEASAVRRESLKEARATRGSGVNVDGRTVSQDDASGTEVDTSGGSGENGGLSIGSVRSQSPASRHTKVTDAARWVAGSQ